MTTLTEFLLARIAEDEALAELAAKIPSGDGGKWFVDGPARESFKWWVYATGEKFDHETIATHIARHDPARVLAECKAKRRLVELSATWSSQAERVEGHDAADIMMRTQAITGETVLRALASVYADHPEFESGWAL